MTDKKSIIIFGIWFLILGEIKAQITFQIFEENKETLVGVQGFLNEAFIDISAENGLVIFPSLNENDQIKFCFLGYKDYLIQYKYAMGDSIEIEMLIDNYLLDEIVLIGRNNELAQNLPYQISRISEKEIFSSQAQTSADVLEKSAAVYVQKSQMGGGSPILRGFEANKVLLVLDGVRLNNAIYRNGHLQSAITIDHSALESAEVIFGPGSLNYGSDAIGGVIHFRTKSPQLNINDSGIDLSGNLYTRYASANNEKRLGGSLNLAKQNWAWYSSISLVDFDNLKAGGDYHDAYPDFGKRFNYIETIDNKDTLIDNPDPRVQVGSAYSQVDLVNKLKFQFDDNNSLMLNFQYSNSSDIPRYDQLIDQEDGKFRFAEWFYGPQERLLLSPTFASRKPSNFYDEIIGIAGYQRIKEERNSRRLDAAFLEIQNEAVEVLSFSLDMKKSLFKNQNLNYGFDWQYNSVESKARAESIFDSEPDQAILTRYPSGGSKLSTGGVYIHQLINFDQINLKWHHGLRFSHQSSSFNYLSSDPFDWPLFYFNGFDNSSSALSWMNAFSYKPFNKLVLRWAAASAFRAPNIDDLAKTRVKSDEINIPNPDLTPEKTINTDFSVIFNSNLFKLDFTAYYTRLTDAIVRVEGQLPDGNSAYIIGNDSLAVTQNFNVEEAEVFGFSFGAIYEMSNSLSVGGQINYTKGTSIENEQETPLAHIPPVYGKIFFDSNWKDLSAKIVMRYNGKKALENYGGSSDNPELATPEGALAWHTYNVYINYSGLKNLDVSFSIENIMDKHYRNFASGFSAAGRNFVLGINYNFK